MNEQIEHLIKEAFFLGFMITRKGFNAECAYDYLYKGFHADHESEADLKARLETNDSYLTARAELLKRYMEGKL